MHIDAVNDDVRVLEARAECYPGRDADQLLAGEGVHHHDGNRRIRRGQHLVGHADAIEHMKDIGSELDAVADGAELQRAFKDARTPSAARQGERGREAAKPAPDDEDRFGGHDFRLAVEARGRNGLPPGHMRVEAALASSRSMSYDIS